MFPWSGLIILLGQSQHTEGLPPARDGASISCNGHLPKKAFLDSPISGLSSFPQGCWYVHALMHHICGMRGHALGL